MNLRIEMTVPSMPIGGMETVVARLARALTARGHDVGITCIETLGAFGEVLRREGLRITVVRLPGTRTILFPAALTRWFRELRPDVVHTHSGAWLKCARAAAHAGVPRILHTAHGLLDREPWHGPPLMRWAALYTKAIAAVSRPLHDYLRQRARIPAGRLHVVPNGIDTSAFQPGAWSGAVRARFRLSDDRVLVGHVGRFTAVKNQALLLEAFALLCRKHPAAFLVLVGDGALRLDLERSVAQLGISDRVGFFGSAHELAPIYRDFDVFVLSSLAEGTSMSILEAMATGLCVVATAVGGNPDLLDAGNAGCLVPSSDARALADTLGLLLANPERRLNLGRAARNRAVSTYSHDAVIDRYEALYSSEPEESQNTGQGLVPEEQNDRSARCAE
jgi:sugar transferase (PEP-CTERM/EpsH1 system associated)